MDAIKNAVKGAKGGAAENKDPNAQGQKEDYVDKGTRNQLHVILRSEEWGARC